MGRDTPCMRGHRADLRSGSRPVVCACPIGGRGDLVNSSTEQVRPHIPLRGQRCTTGIVSLRESSTDLPDLIGRRQQAARSHSTSATRAPSPYQGLEPLKTTELLNPPVGGPTDPLISPPHTQLQTSRWGIPKYYAVEQIRPVPTGKAMTSPRCSDNIADGGSPNLRVRDHMISGAHDSLSAN